MAIDTNQIKSDYFNFDGSISKQQFQKSALILFLIGLALNIISRVLAVQIVGLLILVIDIGLLIGWFSITIRRLRDLGHSGLLSILLIIPLINLILIIYLLIADRKIA